MAETLEVPFITDEKGRKYLTYEQVEDDESGTLIVFLRRFEGSFKRDRYTRRFILQDDRPLGASA